jgi:hypothetical protein
VGKYLRFLVLIVLLPEVVKLLLLQIHSAQAFRVYFSMSWSHTETIKQKKKKKKKKKRGIKTKPNTFLLSLSNKQFPSLENEPFCC